MTNRRFILAATLLASLTMDHGAWAADGPAVALSAADRSDVQKVVDYVDGLKAAQGRFSQTDPKGQLSRGVFYLERPGKARFQYDPPAQLLLVADGVNVSVYDRKLKSFDQYPLSQTPLALLLAKPFRLDRGVSILAVKHSIDSLSITAGDARRTVPGRLTLTFSQTPFALTGWTLIDAQGQRTDVRFAALKRAGSLDPALFVLHNPNPHSEESDVIH